MKLTHKRLLKVFDYNPETGLFYWKQSWPKRRAGEIAGSLKHTGYWEVRFGGTDYLAHRLAWFFVYGVWPKRLDHRDGDRVNNRIVNLREATVSQNAANKKRSANSTSGVKGVRVRPNKEGEPRWQAHIEVRCNGRRKHITVGTFDTRELAAAAYFGAAEQHFGEFARGT